ncbi:MAG TPA: helix-turn-helix domain-containing protein [Pyrinomonadaceae bacterium]|nr:helix-turn-helix domain-containing protein [Pyrinomonadaceae bacterium]
MSLTLGEKLQQAREARGATIAEVAEQTRISPLYIESIENNDYRPLPGGIFNKGFVKSFAKYVGVDEQEALQDYLSLMANQEIPVADEPKTYKPEVLTDERANSSNLMTIVFAVIILGLMTWGILTLVNYLQNKQNQSVANTNTNSANNAANENSTANTNVNVSQPLPSMDEISAEFKVTEEVAATVIADGKKTYPIWTATTPTIIKAKDSLNVSYSKSKAAVAQMILNGKPITLPSQGVPGTAVVKFEINKTNIAEILQSGQISIGTMPNSNTNVNTAR